ncbi:MAG: nuclear transport factor 2 family protein [Pseudomonadota bacterium]
MSQSEIERLTAEWCDGWNVEDRSFDGETFRDLFARGDNAITVFDNVHGDVLVLRSIDEYVETWGPFMAPMTYWAVRLDDLDITVSGDFALTTFKLVGTDTRGPDGNQVPFGQYGTHVWRRFEREGWRIVHEHLTAYDRARELQT